MPGDSFYSASKFVTLCVIGFTKGVGDEMRFSERVDLEIAEEEVFGVEQEDKFVQPCDQERNDIVTFYDDLTGNGLMYLLG